MSFSDKIRAIRSQYSLSQEELAEKLNVSRQTVSKWELGTSYPEIDKLIFISDLFQVTTDYLLKDSDTAQGNNSLDRLVLKFLGSAQDMDNISKELVDIMRDGVIDADEKLRMDTIIDTLDSIAQIIDEIKLKMNVSDFAKS